MSSGAEASCGPREAGVVLRLSGVSVVRDGQRILDGIHWTVRAGERWAVLGPNGSGKTTLLQVAGARLRPTEGEIEVLGSCIGRVDVRTLHTRVALVSGALVRQLRPTVSAREVVVTGRTGALEPWWHRYDHEDWAAADRLLVGAGLGAAVDRPWGVLSEGERQQVLLCRALVSNPNLLLLDEPAAGLDLGARERLVTLLGSFALDGVVPPIVLVTHHLEEVPGGFTHGALLSAGRLLSAGPLDSVFTSHAISNCFGVRIDVSGAAGRRWHVRAAC
jgi:iron complex transport system ATP-binding protein